MIFHNLQNKKILFNIDIKNFGIKGAEEARSIQQFKLGQILCKIYGSSAILEDFPLPGCGNLSFDFWIPHKNLAFEYDGIQHKEFNNFFHASRDAFVKQTKRDTKKQELALKNNIRLISIPHTIEITPENIKRLILETK